MPGGAGEKGLSPPFRVAQKYRFMTDRFESMAHKECNQNSPIELTELRAYPYNLRHLIGGTRFV